jgi:hypothetical protein
MDRLFPSFDSARQESMLRPQAGLREVPVKRLVPVQYRRLNGNDWN